MIARFIEWLIPYTETDIITKQRKQTLSIILLTMFVLTLLGITINIIIGSEKQNVYILTGSLPIYVSALFSLRHGHLLLATILLIMGCIAIIVINVALEAYPFSLSFFAVILVMASSVMAGRQIWVVLGAFVLMSALVFMFSPMQAFQHEEVRVFLIGCGLLLLIVALLSHLNAASIVYALRQSEHASQEASAAHAELLANNELLNQNIAERTHSLAQALEQQRIQTASVRDSLATQQQLHQTILALSLPIIPITDQVLVVPLIGSINSERAQHMLDTLLHQVQQARARALVLDVTGIALIDTQTASVIMQIASGLRLLGAQMVLVGIRPEVAQTLVLVGVDMQFLLRAASLQEALRLVHVNVLISKTAELRR